MPLHSGAMTGIRTAILAVFFTALASQAWAKDRLIDACEVAVAVHADSVQLSFPEAKRTAWRVDLTFQFENHGNLYAGEASCDFRVTADDEPPSLQNLETMGERSAAMFLKSHHAVWSHFAGTSDTVAEQREIRRQDEDKPRPASRLIAAR